MEPCVGTHLLHCDGPSGTNRRENRSDIARIVNRRWIGPRKAVALSRHWHEQQSAAMKNRRRIRKLNDRPYDYTRCMQSIRKVECELEGAHHLSAQLKHCPRVTVARWLRVNTAVSHDCSITSHRSISEIQATGLKLVKAIPGPGRAQNVLIRVQAAASVVLDTE